MVSKSICFSRDEKGPDIAINLIKAAHLNNVPYYVYLGSSCIYPKESKQPIKEEYLLTGKPEPTNEGYALSKIVGLKSCEYYNKKFGKNYITLMPCNLYGPNDNFNAETSHVIPALIRKFIINFVTLLLNFEISSLEVLILY